MYHPKQISYGITLQYENVIVSENSLEEVWLNVEKLGVINFVKKYKYNLTGNSFDDLIRYSCLRIRQSIEFRKSYQNMSILTSPLLLYYSFLNLLRGIYALKYEKKASKRHGLCFISGDNILNCSAKINSGTFSDYLISKEIKFDNKKNISLKDSIMNIIELQNEVEQFGLTSNVIPVNISLFMDGHVNIYFVKEINDLKNNWNIYFPQLTGVFNYVDERNLSTNIIDNIRQIDSKNHIIDNKKIINQLFYTDLIKHKNNDSHDIWYLIKNKEKYLDRGSYYYIALFILSSIARYEPEMLQELNDKYNEYSWLIKKLLNLAERFFPQILFGELYSKIIYFTTK